MQFFKYNGQWLTTDQMRKVRERLTKEAERFCPYCVSAAMRHLKDCPTKLPDFNVETTHKLTEEEREEIIKKRNS